MAKKCPKQVQKPKRNPKITNTQVEVDLFETEVLMSALDNQSLLLGLLETFVH
jgi:hypothetical protein